jgi:hypothetical protein
MTHSPKQEKTKLANQRIVRGEIKGTEQGCIRGIVVFLGLLLFFGVVLFVLSQLG